jgi:hypothetical protein
MNDLLRRGWSYDDFARLFDTNKEKQEQPLFAERFLYNRVANHFFDVLGMQKAEPKDMWYATHIPVKQINEIIGQ